MACGGAPAPGPAEPTAAASAGGSSTYTRLHVAFEFSEVTIEEDGSITAAGEPLGRLDGDRRILRADGTELAHLAEDGRVVHADSPARAQIEGDHLDIGAPNGFGMRIVDEGGELFAEILGTARRAGPFPVEGYTPESARRLFFVVGAWALDSLGRQASAPPPRALDEPRLRVPADDAPARGPEDALVTLVVFSDFQCPFCGRLRPTLERILSTFAGDVRVVFRHEPLPFHDRAMPAAEAAMEAYAQRGDVGFWQMHDLLFERQRELGEADLERYASELGLDEARFREALASHTHRARIEDDVALAAQFGATGTPTTFINGRALRGAQPFEEFERVIRDELRIAAAAIAAGAPRASYYATVLADALDAVPASERPAHAGPVFDYEHRADVGSGAGSPTRGPQSAPVTIQVFSDLQCPFCARHRATLDRIVETYGPRVRVVFRHYPLTPMHAWARDAAELSVEVQRQRGDAAFWQFHDLVFENQRALNDAEDARGALLTLAGRIRGVDVRRARRALDAHTAAPTVLRDMDALQAVDERVGVPVTFVQGVRVSGAVPFEIFQQVIDHELGEGADHGSEAGRE